MYFCIQCSRGLVKITTAKLTFYRMKAAFFGEGGGDLNLKSDTELRLFP